MSTMTMETKLWNACFAEDPVEVKRLLDAGHAVDELDSTGRTAMWVACRYGDYKIAKILLDHGASVHTTTKELGVPLLLRACGDSWRHVDVAKMLLERGADVNQTDAAGWTPLMHAVMARNTELVKLLLKHNALRGATVGQGMVPAGTTAADLARQMNEEAMAKLVEVEKPIASGA